VGTSGADTFVFSGTVGVSVTGGSGADTYTAGGGNDVFIFSNTADSFGAAIDTINNFAAGAGAGDRIDLNAITSGTGALVTDATTYANGGTAQAIVRTAGVLEVDTDGNGITDMRVNLAGIGVNGLHSDDIRW
jgi:Ca2+-binding RTX toxin-like protein